MDWLKTYDLNHLKKIVNIFKENEKEFIYGQFSKIKERDLIKYLDNNTIIYTDSACILWRTLKRNSFRTDFRGKKIILKKGDIVVDRFTASSILKGLNVFNSFVDKIKHENIIVFLFEEDSITKEIIMAKKFNYLSSKIMSTSEIVGIYSNPPKTLFFEKPKIDIKEKQSLCLANNIVKTNCSVSDIDFKKIKTEMMSYNEFYQHYSHYNKRKSWSAFSVIGYIKEDPSFIIKPSEMSKKWKEENKSLVNASPGCTKISNLFPNTIKFAERFGKIERLRFMKLSSKGELSRHADITNKEAGVSKGKVARFHLPIISNEKVEYYSWGLRGIKINKQFYKPELFYLDQRKPHKVINNSDFDRINLVMDIIL